LKQSALEKMRIKNSKSSRREKPVKKKKEPIAKIDFSEIPETSDAQLAAMRRVGRPSVGEKATDHRNH
jgi:hypothetical protein